MDRARRREVGWEDWFLFIYFFVNRFQVCFVQCFTIIIIKCKASFSCHSSSSYYSTKGIILISFHFIFSFLKNKIVYNFTCDLLFSFRISELKNVDRHTKNISQKLPNEWLLERKCFHFFHRTSSK